jgi:hypothetical protein
MSRKTNLVTAGTLALLAFAGLTACGGGTHGTMSPGSYAAHGVSFHYPRGWHRGAVRLLVRRNGRSRRLWSVGVGLDKVNGVDVVASRLPVVVTRQNLPELTPTLVRAERVLFRRRLHGEAIGGPHAVIVGGMPSLRFAGTAKMYGAAENVTLVVATNGRTGYAIACSSTPAKARAVQQACAQVLRTFKVGKLFTPGAALAFRKLGVSFDYPPAWAQGSAAAVACSQCKSSASGVALDQVNTIEVIVDRHVSSVNRMNLRQVTPIVTRIERREFRQSGGRLLAGPHAVTVGGLPGLRYWGTGRTHGTAIKLAVAVVFNGTTNYQIACASTPAKARAVNRACAEVLRTFKVTRPSRHL